MDKIVKTIVISNKFNTVIKFINLCDFVKMVIYLMTNVINDTNFIFFAARYKKVVKLR